MTPAETKKSPDELASLFAAIEKIDHRLDKLEGVQVAAPPIEHPSLDKFSVAEAIADSIFSHYKRKGLPV